MSQDIWPLQAIGVRVEGRNRSQQDRAREGFTELVPGLDPVERRGSIRQLGGGSGKGGRRGKFKAGAGQAHPGP